MNLKQQKAYYNLYESTQILKLDCIVTQTWTECEKHRGDICNSYCLHSYLVTSEISRIHAKVKSIRSICIYFVYKTKETGFGDIIVMLWSDGHLTFIMSGIKDFIFVVITLCSDCHISVTTHQLAALLMIIILLVYKLQHL